MSSIYTLNFSDPNTSTTITVLGVPAGPGINNYDTCLDLVGPGYANYGRPTAQNFLKLLENFNSPVAPLRPIKGQVWYDTSNAITNPNYSPVFRINDGTSWTPASGIHKQVIDPSLQFSVKEGDIWVDTGNNQLKFRYSNEWTVVGPVVLPGTNKSGSEPALIEGNAGDHPVILNWVDGKIVEIISYSTFTPRTVIDGFATIKIGTNLTTKVAARYNGLAEKASALATSSGGLLTASEVLKNRATSQVHTGTFYVESLDGLYIRPTSAANSIRVYSESINAARINFVNTASGSTLKVGIQDTTYLKFSSSYNSVGINTSPTSTSPTLDVGGSGRFLNTLTITTASTIALSVGGGAVFGGNVSSGGLMVTGQTTSTGKMTLGTSGSGVILEPGLDSQFDIGTSSKKFKEIYASKVNAIEFVGTLTGSASSLSSPRDFRIQGQVTATSVSFNGTTTTNFVTSLTRNAINSQTTINTATASHTLMVLDTSTTSTSLEKISKSNFLSDVYPSLFQPGMITAYGTSTNIPPGWLACDGSSTSTVAHPALYGIIGETYGIGSLGTFRTPNMSTSTYVGSSTYLTYIIKT
jgi:hypothetical protein